MTVTVGSAAQNRETVPDGFTLLASLRGHDERILSVTWSPDGTRLASTAADNTLRVWTLGSSQSRLLQRATIGNAAFNGARWSADGRFVATSSTTLTQQWDAATGQEIRRVEAPSLAAGQWRAEISWSPDGAWFTSVTDHVRVWNNKTGTLRTDEPTSQFLRGSVHAIGWSPDSSVIAAGADEGDLTVWDPRPRGVRQYGRQSFKGHAKAVMSVAWSPDGSVIAAGASEGSIRIWSVDTGRQTNVLEGHVRAVTSLSFTADGRLLASKSLDGTVRVWLCETWEVVALIDEYAAGGSPELAFHPRELILATLGEQERAIRLWRIDLEALHRNRAPAPPVYFANAKVVLVGDTGVGKTGLAMVLTGKPFVPTESTHGRHVWTLDVAEARLEGGAKETRETLLWDLAGQPGYRVFHRQHLNEVAVALVLFDSRSEVDPFAGVAYWARALDEATAGFPLVKFLVAGRLDRGGPPVSNARIKDIVERYGFDGYFETSSKRGDGIVDMISAVKRRIAWDLLPRISTPALFQRIKDFLVSEKEQGRILQSRQELLERYRVLRRAKKTPSEVFDACLGLVETAGLIKRLTFSDLVLLQPEMLDQYCAWLALAARAEPDGLGYVSERQARRGDFAMDEDRPLVGSPAERTLIAATIEDVTARSIALHQATESGEMLVFPSELRTDMPDYPGTYVRSMVFYFEGPVRAIYATLAVRLAHAPAFGKDQFFRNAAVFRSASDDVCGFAFTYPDPTNDALGKVTAFFGPQTPKTTMLTFLRYIKRQLQDMAFDGSVHWERVYQCGCGYNIPEDAIALRRTSGKKTVVCPVDEQHIPLDDLAALSGHPDVEVDRQLELSDEERLRQSRLSVLNERVQGDFYHVFLCHNSRDKPSVRILAARLRDQGVLPWLDERGILAGTQFVPEIESVIDRIPSAVVTIGSHSLGRWQTQEYYAFIQRYVERRQKNSSAHFNLIPVFLPGAPTQPNLPPFLRGFNWVDFRTGEGLEDRSVMQKLVRAILGNEA